MTSPRLTNPLAFRSLCLTAALSVCLPGLGVAQTQEAGGVLITFGIDQSLQWQDNPDLDIPASGSDTTSRTKLRFGFVSETRTQRLAFDLGGTVVAGNGTESGLVSPSAELSYRLESAASALELAAFLREADVDALDFLTGTDDLGAPVLTAVTGTGTRRQTGADLRLEFGRDAPFGGSFSLGRTNTDYRDTTDASLIDNSRTTAGLTLRFDLTEVTTATATLSGSRLQEDAAPTETTETLTLGLSHDRPDGAYTTSLSISRNDDGTRQALRFGRSIDLPSGKLALSLGLSRPVAGSTQAIGAIDWQQELARGTFRIGLSRDVTGNDRDEETRATRLAVSYSQSLTPTLGLSLSAGYQASRDTLTGLDATTTNISASLRQDLTADWGLNLGATHRIKDEDGVGRAKSSSVFLSLSRDFEFRP